MFIPMTTIEYFLFSAQNFCYKSILIGIKSRSFVTPISITEAENVGVWQNK